MISVSMDDLNYGVIRDKILEYIREFVGDSKVIIGLSGGIDSSIVCALAVEALGKENVKVLIVRNNRYPEYNLRISRDYSEKTGVEIQEVDSTGLRDQAIRSLGIDEENIIQVATMDARICDMIIKTHASMEGRIYLGTINGTERLTGWYPKGNLVGDCCPIGGLLKEQEKRLAQEIGLDYLVETISEDASRVCSGCGELPEFMGIPYKMLDKVLYLYETSRKDELLKKLKGVGIDEKVFAKILRRVSRVGHKNDVFPDYCEINLLI